MNQQLPTQMMGDRCLIEIIPETTREGLIIHTDHTDPRIGIVRVIGNGRRAKKSKQRIPIEGIEVGDRVCVAQFGKWYATLDGKDYWVLESKDLLAKLERGDEKCAASVMNLGSEPANPTALSIQSASNGADQFNPGSAPN